MPAEAVACRGQRNGRNIGPGQLYQGTAIEVSDADAKGCHSKTGDILIGTESNRQEAVQKTHQKRTGKASG